MRKVKITNKWLKDSFFNIIVIPYCDLQYLLQNESAVYYTCGIYGWNADVYLINENTVICTGYRPAGNIRPDRNIVKEYEKKAEDILSWNNKIDYDIKRKQLKALLNEFISKVL